MSLADVAAEHQALIHEVVARETWGHMDANPGTRYRGHIIFAESAFTDPGKVVLACDFGNAGFGPWFYEGIHEWLFDQDAEPGKVYRWEGHYYLAKGGEHKFIGGVVEERNL